MKYSINIYHHSSDATKPLSDMEKRFMDLEANGPKHIWIILVVNVAVLVTAITIGLLCFRRGGAHGPYNMLPGEINIFLSNFF